jgi:pimeloyl-ACP methyl ester carboxylesterase
LIDEAVAGRVLSRDGTPISWFRTGDGPPLVLVHGTTADHTTFRVVAPMFATRHAVFAVDRRGRGASGDSAPYAVEREFEDIAAVVDAVAELSGSAVDVLGHSFGGRCALVASTLTARVRRLVLYESAPAPRGMTFEPGGLVERLRQLETADERPELLRTFLRAAVGLTNEEVAAFEAAPHYAARLSAAHTVARELSASQQDRAMSDVARRIAIPVLQLVGGESPPIFRQGTDALNELLPQGRMVVLPGQKHAAFHGDPERFVAEVEPFLAD